MKKLTFICASCLFALLYPCAELLCWDTAGNRIGSWSEASCDGYSCSGTWTGYVTSDCRFIGANEWESVIGAIDPTTRIFTGAGTFRDGCGSITMEGIFTHDLVSMAGSYKCSKGGGGTFSGRIQP